MAKIGYARVSTRGQNDDSQVDDLTAYGCEKIFTDTASGKNAARPELDNALAYLRKGDVFVITRLSRAMRSLKHLLALADELRDRGGGLVVLKQPRISWDHPALAAGIPVPPALSAGIPEPKALSTGIPVPALKGWPQRRESPYQAGRPMGLPVRSANQNRDDTSGIQQHRGGVA